MPTRILYFGIARDLAGTAEESLELPLPMSQEGLWSTLLERHPDLERVRPITRLACDMSYLPEGGVLTEAPAEIALIPPVAGG